MAVPAVKNLLSLSATLTAGRYTVDVRCRGARNRLYSLGVIAMFPLSCSLITTDGVA